MNDKIRVMIVDDEYIVREDLRSLISWDDAGFQVVCEANNGEQGIALAGKFKPDVIIADIKMPIKDGLQMAEEILASGHEVAFILLTAYDEFDFARKAMRLGISHYLLKHEMEAPVLMSLLEEIRPVVVDRRKQRQQALGKRVREQLLDRKAAEGLPGTDESRSLLLYPLSDRALVLPDCWEYLNVTPVMEDGGLGVLLLEYAPLSELLYRSEVQRFALALSRQAGGPVALSGRGGDLKALYEKARAAMSLSVFFSNSEGVIMPEQPVDAEISRGAVSSTVYLLKECLRLKDYREYIGQLSNFLFAQCKEKHRGAQFSYARPLLLNTLEEHNESLCLLEKRSFEALDSAKDIHSFLREAQSLAEKLEVLKDSAVSKNIRRVLLFIEAHYNEDISLEEIGRILSVNPMYAGQLFKKEMGIPFKQYLCEYRVERAKVLLQTGDYKIYEVGALVGYQTTQYFCNIFKKVTGKSPSDFIR